MSKYDLKWEAKIDDNGKEWVTIDPTTGEGDTNVSINIKNSDVYSENTASTISFKCLNCKDNQTLKKINVCRCVCDCENVTVAKIVEHITESGLGVGEKIGKYSLPDRCNKNAISAIITDNNGYNKPLNCVNGYIELMHNIPYNRNMHEIIYTIYVYFDKTNLPDDCGSFEIVQDGLDCSCNSTVINHITFSDYFNGISKIPQIGLAQGTQLFTYELKEFCPDTSQYFTASINYDSTSININISNGSATLGQSIGINDNNYERDIILRIFYNGLECYNIHSKQIGCTCDNVFPNDEQFRIEVSTFGVNVGDAIGEYVLNKGVLCSESNIEATLSGNDVVYPLVLENGIVKLGGNNNINENIEHESINFTATLKYYDKICDTDTVTQKGVACNCKDVLVNNFVVIPKEGLPSGSIIGEYRLLKEGCSDDNECLKIEEENSRVGIRLERGKVLTTTEIPNNENPYIIEYYFIVKYKINNRWRRCGDPVKTYQKGLECSCSNVDVLVSEDEGAWVVFPHAGTHGEWVSFASGDTGLYMHKGTPQQTFVGVCGKIGAKCGSGYLLEDNEQFVENRISNIGDKVRVIGVPLTDEEREIVIETQGEEYSDVPHLYVLYVNIKEIIGTMDILTVKPSLTFFGYNGEQWEEEDCTDKKCGFMLSPYACDCNYKPSLSIEKVSCEGTSGREKTLGFIKGVDRHNDMSIEAVLLNPLSSLISDFRYLTKDNGDFEVLGKVLSENTPGGPERVIGVVRLFYSCNKGKPNQWNCGYNDYNLIQEKCPKCDCDYIKDYSPDSDEGVIITIKHNETSVTEFITSYFKLDCGEMYIEGQDNSGIYNGGWFTATIEKHTDEYGWNGYVLSAFLKEGEVHQKRSATITGIVKLNGETCVSFPIIINDEVCDCDALESIEWDMNTGETVTIAAGRETTSRFIQYTNVYDCIEFFIDGEQDTDNHVYTDPDNYFIADVDNNSNNAWIYIKKNKDFDSDKQITIKAKYIDQDGETVICNNEYLLTIKQQLCDCDSFKSRITTYTSFNQNDEDLYVASIYGDCGDGKLYVLDGENGYSTASDIPSTSPLYGIIESINECTSSEGCCRRDFYLKVKKLEEGESRQIDLGICRCINGESEINENNECTCLYEFQITQTNQYSCSDTSCSGYDFGIDWPSVYHLNVYSGTTGEFEIVRFNKLPENYEDCFKYSITCSDSNIKHFSYDTEENGRYILKAELIDSPTVGAVPQFNFNYYFNENMNACDSIAVQILITDSEV